MVPAGCSQRFMTIAFFSNMYCSISGTMTAIGVDRYLGHPLSHPVPGDQGEEEHSGVGLPAHVGGVSSAKLARTPRRCRRDRAMRLTATVLLVFVVCFAPNNVLLLAHTVRRFFYNDSLYMAYKLSLCLSCLNSCLDPFIYYFASKEFRHKLRQMLRLGSLSTSDIGRGTEHKESLFLGPSSV
ncbi:unnamed protein product [Boreogadus saida]